MEIEALAQEAYSIIYDLGYEIRKMHGVEIAPGFFNLYNEFTGQSKTVLYHPESGFVFKRNVVGNESDKATSRLHLGFVEIDGFKYSIRLPEHHRYMMDDRVYISAQEYVIGEMHECGGSYTCEHTAAMKAETGCFDCHVGNWKVCGDEIILFDFEGIRVE